jgi:hypothetical protein
MLRPDPVGVPEPVSISQICAAEALMAALHSAIRMAPFPDWVFPEKAKMFAYWLGGTDRPEVLHERILEVAGTQCQ